jgi:hypothetical protein
MKTTLRTLSLMTAALAVTGILISIVGGKAIAQIRAALVKNVDEPGRAPYQQMIEFNSGAPACPLSQFCLLTFSPVPAGKRLIVERATALIGVVSPGQVTLWTFGDLVTSNTNNVAIL